MSRRADILRKAHSLTGVLPLGVFLFLHLSTNASALKGVRAYTQALDNILRVPFIGTIELVGVLLPLGFHAGYGVWLAVRGTQDARRYGAEKSFLYLLQRVTGVLTLVFVAAHVFELRVPRWRHGMHAHSLFGAAASDLSWVKWGVPWIALGYVLGLAATVFHFTNGLVAFARAWGTRGTKRARRASIAAVVLGVGLFALGLLTVVYFSTGQTLLPVPEDVGPPVPPCPPAK